MFLAQDIKLFYGTTPLIESDIRPDLNKAYTLAKESGLETAITIALFTDRRVDSEGGCWIDSFTTDFKGSKLWLLKRSSLTAETLQRYEEYVDDALKIFVDRKIFSKTKTSAARDLDNYNRINFLTKFNIQNEELKAEFFIDWGRQIYGGLI